MKLHVALVTSLILATSSTTFAQTALTAEQRTRAERELRAKGLVVTAVGTTLTLYAIGEVAGSRGSGPGKLSLVVAPVARREGKGRWEQVRGRPHTIDALDLSQAYVPATLEEQRAEVGFIQDDEVGVKWDLKRGWRASHGRTLGCLWVA